MTTTQTAGGPKVSTNGNGTPKAKRTRKALTAKSAGIKIADLLEPLSKDDRARALHIAKTLGETETSAS